MNRLACFLLLILLSCGTASALSEDGGGIWDYSRDIVIQETSGNTLRNYNVLIELEDGNFPTEAQEDGVDIRFTDEDDNELNYRIEKFDSSTKRAKIWVKVPYVPASSKTKIKMYYGNPEANPVSTLNILRYPDVSGSWTGTLNQYDTEKKYSFNLDISQDGSKVYGNSKIVRLQPNDGYYAIMEFSGSVNDRILNFKELRSIEEYSPGFDFFLKNVNLKFDGKFPSTLEGYWDCYWNSNTYGGTISLRRDSSESVTNVTILEPQILSVVVSKTASPQSIRQFQESTITVKIENIGRTEIIDIQVVDSISSPSLDLVGGNFPHPHKFDILDPEDTEEIQYTIRAKESGTFSLDPCTVTFADKELNIQEIKSEPVSLKVIPSITEQDLKSNTEEARKNSLAKYIIIILVCGIILIKKALKPSIGEYSNNEKQSATTEEPASTKEQAPKTGQSGPIKDSNTKLFKIKIIDIIVGIIVTVVGIIIQKKFFP
jgi:hypothetical protein